MKLIVIFPTTRKKDKNMGQRSKYRSSFKEQGDFPSEKDPKLYDICNIPFIDETTASSPDVIKQIVAHGYVKQPMRKKPHSII